MAVSQSTWRHAVVSHFVLCTFLGLVVVDASLERVREVLHMEGGPRVGEVFSVMLGAGSVVAAVTWLLDRLWFNRIRRAYFPDRDGTTQTRQATVIGFICGALCPVYLVLPTLLPFLALLFLMLSIFYVRTFLKRVALVLRPGNHPAPTDVVRLAFIYGALVACFTLLNVAILTIHGYGNPAYRGITGEAGFIVETLYFTVVVMTTLGFGDITPVTADAKIVVAVQVVIAYLLFALLIGMITRGILPRDAGPEKDEPGDD